MTSSPKASSIHAIDEPSTWQLSKGVVLLYCDRHSVKPLLHYPSVRRLRRESGLHVSGLTLTCNGSGSFKFARDIHDILGPPIFRWPCRQSALGPCPKRPRNCFVEDSVNLSLSLQRRLTHSSSNQNNPFLSPRSLWDPCASVQLWTLLLRPSHRMRRQRKTENCSGPASQPRRDVDYLPGFTELRLKRQMTRV